MGIQNIVTICKQPNSNTKLKWNYHYVKWNFRKYGQKKKWNDHYVKWDFRKYVYKIRLYVYKIILYKICL